ncbi:protein PELPK1-like [Syzygium oleosum]|uniref:protein PELPK1-like n=1 Tax=Syzygium oleosum TaxID=219896 RepID=UPI0024B93FC7|nr:protein PELPK1-like [Syzygium oleosum]
MAKYHGLAHLLALFVLALSLTIGENPVGARRLLEGTLPEVPELPKPELPHLPDISSLPKPEFPSLPKVELLPLPELPKPEFPTIPKPELPEVPELPHLVDFPKPTLPFVPTVPEDKSAAATSP